MLNRLVFIQDKNTATGWLAVLGVIPLVVMILMLNTNINMVVDGPIKLVKLVGESFDCIFQLFF